MPVVELLTQEAIENLATQVQQQRSQIEQITKFIQEYVSKQAPGPRQLFRNDILQIMGGKSPRWFQNNVQNLPLRKNKKGQYWCWDHELYTYLENEY